MDNSHLFHPEKTPGLYERIVRGDQAAFTSVFSQYRYRLVYYLQTLLSDRNDVDDVIADSFMALWKSRERINIETGDMRYYFIHLPSFRGLKPSMKRPYASFFICGTEIEFRGHIQDSSLKKDQILGSSYESVYDSLYKSLPAHSLLMKAIDLYNSAFNEYNRVDKTEKNLKNLKTASGLVKDLYKWMRLLTLHFFSWISFTIFSKSSFREYPFNCPLRKPRL